jgi:hypothetical protein
MSTLPTGQSGRSPDSVPRFIPLYRHPLIWLSAALCCASFLLLAAAAVAAVAAALNGGAP